MGESKWESMEAKSGRGGGQGGRKRDRNDHRGTK
jgi:hypothetical protein